MVGVTLADIEQAAERLRGVAADLPYATARVFADAVGGPAWLVPENLQRTGSFKLRGAYNRLARLSDAERARGVVAASAGNHGQGVALAAQLLGIKATVFMPEGATIPKVQATRGYGAEVRFAGQTLGESLAAAERMCEQTGSVFVHPFDHPDVIAGQGTVGLEIIAKVPDVRTIVVCVGGGGLVSGVAVAAKSIRPEVKVIGVQAAAAAAYPVSLAAGHPVTLESMSTMADGIAVPRPGDLTFAIVRELVDEMRTVSEGDISSAVLLLLERMKMLVEPSGAVAAASVLAQPLGIEPPVAIVVSGGNVDSLLLMRIIRHGLAAAGRYLAIRVRMADRPGSLAALLADIQRMDANIIDVEHNRFDPDLAVDEVGIVVHVETRGREHGADVLESLRSSGYALHDR